MERKKGQEFDQQALECREKREKDWGMAQVGEHVPSRHRH
jgi:hypothetical protein